MNWEDLRIFDAAASSGSLSAGAKAIGMSQPQVSRRIRELEQHVGARLFDRTPQGLRPTVAGAKLIPLAADLRKAADAIARAKPDIAADESSVVRISVDEIREHFLTSHLQFLRQDLSGLDLEIFSGHEHLDHESRMTDIQIRSCLPDNETLIARRLGSTSYGFFASQDLLRQHFWQAKTSKICELPWIGFSPDHLWYPLQQRFLESVFDSVSTLRFNSMTGMIRAASKGQGVALLPRFMAAEHQNLIDVARHHEDLQTIEYLIVHRDLLRENAVRKAMNTIVSLYKSKRGLLSGA